MYILVVFFIFNMSEQNYLPKTPFGFVEIISNSAFIFFFA